MHSSIESARNEATTLASATGEPACVVSGRKDGAMIFRVYSMKGFGLPAGGTLEEVVLPAVERIDPEPPEKDSTNGF
jgi:hypothetical protein